MQDYYGRISGDETRVELGYQYEIQRNVHYRTYIRPLWMMLLDSALSSYDIHELLISPIKSAFPRISNAAM